jgi:membrane protein DedA with SNARE-associated domain
LKRLSQFIVFLTPYGPHSYAVMFGVLIACGFGLPMPEDIVLVTGGILSSRGVTDFWMTVIVCMVGVLMGDGIIYTLGRLLGRQVKQTWLFKRLLSPQKDARIQEIFERWGDKVIFMARFMPGLRMPIFMSSGIYRVPAWKFFMLDGVAALISVPTWIYVGYLFGSNLDLLERKMRRLQMGIYSLVILAVVGIVIFIFVKNRINKRILNEAHRAHERSLEATRQIFADETRPPRPLP